MKANELRIGNFISDTNASDRFFAPVKKLDFSRCYYGQFHSAYSDLKPIPLTEDWLLRFGFQDDNKEEREKYKHFPTNFLRKNVTPLSRYFWVYRENDPLLAKRKDIRGIEQGEFQVWANQSYCMSVQYVHELQNLYFALTKQELTLNIDR